MFKQIVKTVFILLWTFCNIKETTSELQTGKFKKVLPAFYGINVYHRVRSSNNKPKPVYGPPSKFRILNSKPVYGPPKIANQFNYDHNCDNFKQSFSNIPETYNGYFPSQQDGFLTPPKPAFSGEIKPPNSFESEDVPKELEELIYNKPEFFEDTSSNIFKSIPFKSAEEFESLNKPQNEQPVEIPNFHNPPLTFNPAQSTYDTPGAVTSYGTPVQNQNFQKLPSHDAPHYAKEDFRPKQQSTVSYEDEDMDGEKYTFPDIYEIYKSKKPASLSKNTAHKAVHYSVPPITGGDKIEDFFAVNFNLDYKGDKQHESYSGFDDFNSEQLKSDKDFTEVRYPNHRYDI